jgi:hypothetical protein
MSRAFVILVAASLCGCAAPAKKPALEAWPEYKVDATIGLVVTAWATSMKLIAPDSAAAASLEAAAEKKRKNAAEGVAGTALTILLVPLAIPTPVAPMAAQFAVLPFAAGSAAAEASRDADQLKQAAAKARLDAACSEQVGAAHPDLAEKLQHAVPGDTLLQAVQAEVGESVHARARVPVVRLDPQRNENEAWTRERVVRDASRRGLSTLFAIEIQSLDLRVEAASEKPGDCGYALETDSVLTWWNVRQNLKLYQADTLANHARLRFDTTDLPSLLDQPEEFRLRVARAYRDAVLGTLDAPTLKFVNAQP